VSTEPAEPGSSEAVSVVAGFAPPPETASYQAWPPASRPPATGRARWRLLALVAGGVGGSALLAVACAAAVTFGVRSTDNNLSQPTDPPTFPQPTVAPFSGVYPSPTDLCLSADFTRMHPLFPRVSRYGDTETIEPGTGVRVASCDGITGGSAEVEGDFHLEAAAYRDVAAAAREYARGRVARAGAEMAGVGQAAYSYLDTDRGQSVTVRDYNLIITMSWRPATSNAVPDALVSTLASVCRSSLVVLRIG
jgi:hypothetical protein